MGPMGSTNDSRTGLPAPPRGDSDSWVKGLDNSFVGSDIVMPNKVHEEPVSPIFEETEIPVPDVTKQAVVPVDVHVHVAPTQEHTEKKQNMGNYPAIPAALMSFSCKCPEGGISGCIAQLRNQPECFENFVDGTVFSLFSSTAILANTIYIGWETNKKMEKELARLEENSTPAMSTAAEYFFTIFFIIELLMRVVAQKFRFVLGKDRFWNFFDSFLIALSFVQMVADTGSNLTVFRIFRIFRSVRLLKVIRRFRPLESLNLMVLGILNCVVPLFWAILLLLLIMYACGVFFMSCIVSHLQSVTPTEMASNEDISTLVTNLGTNYGTMYKAMCRLFEGITGGNDWANLAVDLKSIGEGYYLCFALYIVFITLGVLNIVTGFFVDNTISAGVSARQGMVSVALEKKFAMMELINDLFYQLNSDGSGMLSWEELESHLYDEDLQEYFCVLGMEPSDAKDLFCLIDIRCQGEVSIDEFMNGCLRVLGIPKNLDICTVMYQSKRIMLMLESMTGKPPESMDGAPCALGRL